MFTGCLASAGLQRLCTATGTEKEGYRADRVTGRQRACAQAGELGERLRGRSGLGPVLLPSWKRLFSRSFPR